MRDWVSHTPPEDRWLEWQMRHLPCDLKVARWHSKVTAESLEFFTFSVISIVKDKNEFTLYFRLKYFLHLLWLPRYPRKVARLLKLVEKTK